MVSLKNEKGKVVQIGEGFSFKFLVFGPFAWVFSGIPTKFLKSAFKCCLIIPWVIGFMGAFNKELMEYYLKKGYSRV